MVFASYLNFILLEPLKEKQRQERYQRGWEEGYKQGREQANAEWRPWYNRLLEAKSRGEPPPGE